MIFKCEEINKAACNIATRVSESHGTIIAGGVTQCGLPLSFESAGYIDQKFAGRLMVKVGNFNHKKIQLSASTPVAYIALASFSIE